MARLNSFQKWADAYGRAFGFVVSPVGNWVHVSRGAISSEVFTVRGLQSLCAAYGKT